MKSSAKRAVTAVCCALLLTSFASAHPGRTDASGGHWDNSTGEYHYHHGYPAHQHTNGVCPYDYDDQTGASSGSSSEYVSPTITSDAEELSVSDYGPEAEDDFDSKREAYESGFESGVEYSRDEDIEGNAYHEGYHEGYDVGYDEGSSYYDDDSYDEGYENGYNRGYRDGYYADRSSPDNDIIDRSEIPSSELEHEKAVADTNSQKQKHWEKSLFEGYHIETMSIYALGIIAVLALLVLLWSIVNGK